jgi:hypothetical protein
MKWGRRWGNLWGGDEVTPIEIIDFEEIPPAALVKWTSQGAGILYWVYVDGQFYATTTGLEIIVQFIDFGRHWVEILFGGTGNQDEDLAAFLSTIPGSRVKLTWTASASSDVDHYKVYMLVAAVWTLQGQTKSKNDVTFITNSLVDGTYDFRVDPVDTAGNQTTSASTKQVVIARYPDPPTALALDSYDTGTQVGEFSFTESGSAGVVGTHVYHNSGSGDIDYTTIKETVLAGNSDFSLTMSTSGEWKVGIRAYNASLEEDNVDEFAAFELGGSPVDQLDEQPNIPEALAAIAAAGGTFTLRCTYDATDELGFATIINYYANDGLGGAINYAATVATATVPDHTQGDFEPFEIEGTSSALVDTRTYIFAARSATAGGRESDSSDTASAICDATAPDDISGLTAEAVNYAEDNNISS